MSASVEAQQEAAEREWLAAWLGGPRRLAWRTMPPQTGEPAPDLQLQDAAGQQRRLSEFWSQGPVLLIFLRHCSMLPRRARLRPLSLA